MGLVLCSLPLSLQCWRKSRFRTEQWTRSTSLFAWAVQIHQESLHNVLCLKSKDILRGRTGRWIATYNLCFQWSQLGEDASSHTETNTRGGHSPDFMLMQEDCLLRPRNTAPLCNMKPTNCFFVPDSLL